MSKADYFEDLQKRIISHPGKPIFEALRVYDMSKFVLDGNIDSLRRLICFLEDPKDIRILSVDRRTQLQWYFHDANRHIHNFLTSITTLVDHTRHLMKENFIKNEHREEYQNKVSAIFASDPLARFLQDFRNYITHYEIPRLRLHTTVGSSSANSLSGELLIELDHLQTGFNWSAPSRKFIETNKSNIRMLKLVNDYDLKSETFYRELTLTFQKHLGKELGEIQSMMQQSNNLWEEMTKSRRR